MKAVFTGKDGSMGFKKGKEYWIKTSVKSGFLWVIDLNTGNLCPYESLESLLDNWRVYGIHGEPECRHQKFDLLTGEWSNV